MYRMLQPLPPASNTQISGGGVDVCIRLYRTCSCCPPGPRGCFFLHGMGEVSKGIQGGLFVSDDLDIFRCGTAKVARESSFPQSNFCGSEIRWRSSSAAIAASKCSCCTGCCNGKALGQPLLELRWKMSELSTRCLQAVAGSGVWTPFPVQTLRAGALHFQLPSC